MKWLATVTVLMGLSLVAAGCGSPENVETAHLSLSGVNISYSYPADYELPSNGLTESTVAYLRFLDQEETSDADRMLFIGSVPATGSAANMLDEDIWAIMLASRDFLDLANTTIQVDGYDASVASFTATMPSSLVSSTTTTWVAYFKREDRMWQFGVTTTADLEGAAEADFMVLAESFKFE